MTSYDVIPAAAAQSDPSPKLGKGCANQARLMARGQFLFVALCAIFAFLLTWICGRRGFFALDQSIVFDGGYRVAGGQVIYRDFVAPSGPLVYWLQGAVFKLFGVSYRVYILTAAGCNLLAAVGAFVLLKRLLRDCWLWAAAGMLITAAWFYPISGTPFMENTGFLVVLVALLLAVPSDGRRGIPFPHLEILNRGETHRPPVRAPAALRTASAPHGEPIGSPASFRWP